VVLGPVGVPLMATRQTSRGLGYDLTLTAVQGDRLNELGDTEPDPAWTYVDDAGHGHLMKDGKYPTLEKKGLGCDEPDHGDDCPGVTYYACKACGETVRPGRKTARPQYGEPTVTCELTMTQGSGVTYTWTFPQRGLERLEREIQQAIKQVATAEGWPSTVVVTG
jgi:hypothetical protein